MKRWHKSKKKRKEKKMPEKSWPNYNERIQKKNVVVKKETEKKNIPSFNIYKTENTSPITAGDC